MRLHPKLVEAALRKRHGLPDAFAFYKWERLPAGLESNTSRLTGEMTCGVMKSGKRKGEPRYLGKKTRREFYVSDDEDARIAVEYESVTGLCADCEGKGVTIASSSITSGNKYRPCGRCSGKK